LLRLVVTGFVISVGIGVVAGLTFHALGYVRSPFLLAVALSATSLGLVVPVLKDAGQATSAVGQAAIAGATVADFARHPFVLLLEFRWQRRREGRAARRLRCDGGGDRIRRAACRTLDAPG
jgi:Kef-type K+ transport system membrane component KefB